MQNILWEPVIDIGVFLKQNAVYFLWSLSIQIDQVNSIWKCFILNSQWTWTGIKIILFKVRHDDRSHHGRGLHPAQQRGDGAGSGDRVQEQDDLRPGHLQLQSSSEGDLLRHHHWVHGLGECLETPCNHQVDLIIWADAFKEWTSSEYFCPFSLDTFLVQFQILASL